MSKPVKNAISPIRSENFPEWYQQVIKAADMAENSPTRGCMVIKPWGYGLWENMQQVLDRKFKDSGHVNAYFPLLIPLSFLEKEAEHVEGFAKECAVVTHHRLEIGEDGRLVPAGPLEEPLVVRPTSETIIGASYAKWVQSYRDLPILINQWANVMRWEMRTRLFIRTAEFLWQEGHTVHATAVEAVDETLKMLRIYQRFAEDYMAMPVICGRKTPDEKFPGAVDTYTIETILQDGKALQAGTSHFLGQNFAKASEIKFLDQEGQEVYAWTTSWGVTTRLIGGLIMSHGDDDGMVMPPRLAPIQIVILPIYKKAEERDEILHFCKNLQHDLQSQKYSDQGLRVSIDDRDIRGGEKSWQHIKKGVPIRLEIGPRDLAKGQVFVGRRDLGPKEKEAMDRDRFVSAAPAMLGAMQDGLLERAKARMASQVTEASSLEEFKNFFATDARTGESRGCVAAYASHEPTIKKLLKELKISARCMPLTKGELSNERGSDGRGVNPDGISPDGTSSDNDSGTGVCIFTGLPAQRRTLFGPAY